MLHISRSQIKKILLMLSIAGNVGLGATTLYQNFTLLGFEESNLKLQQRLAESQNEPRIQQRHIILTGEAFRRLTEVDWNVAIMTGDTLGTFVSTPEAIKFIAMATSKDQISNKQIQGTFLQLQNTGNVSAENIELVDTEGKSIKVGSLSSTITKFILLSYEIKKPYRQLTALSPKTIHYEYQINDKVRQGHTPYIQLSSTSWTPSLDTKIGVGSALFGNRTSHMLED